MGQVFRRQSIEGVTIPAIIHNSSYFLTRLAVYADGVVSCWRKADLHQFKEELRRGWVVPQVPLGQQLVVDMSRFYVEQAQWDGDACAFYRRVWRQVRRLNPEMANIYRTTPREIAKWDKARVRLTAEPTPYQLRPGLGYFRQEGRAHYIFYRGEQGLCLTELTVYANQTFALDALPGQSFSWQEVKTMFDQGQLATGPQGKEQVTIEGIGRLLLRTASAVSQADKLAELADCLAQLAGKKDSLDLCREAHYAYLVEPCEFTREKLRQAYEAVPKHQRMFLGDMDSRDSDFRRIIYHPEQKREV